jgi:hypothetical protein
MNTFFILVLPDHPNLTASYFMKNMTQGKETELNEVWIDLSYSTNRLYLESYSGCIRTTHTQNMNSMTVVN